MSHESSSPAPSIPQAVPTHPSSSPTAESWTTHDSNLALLECLSIATPKRPALPTELILQILDHPTRWVHLYGITHPPPVEPQKWIRIVSNKPIGQPILFTRRFTAQEVRDLRKIVFTFRSRDQGFCSNRDQGCWSWFETCLARLPSPYEGPQDEEWDAWAQSWCAGEWVARYKRGLETPPRYRIQENRLASTEIEEYTVDLTDEHELVQRVREGDRVVLLACACFPGWENRVYAAEISVLGVDDLTMEYEKDGH